MKYSKSASSFFIPEWEVFQEILHIEEKHCIQLNLHHVKSHQDKSVRYQDLPLEVQLNIQADQLAEQRRRIATGNTYSPLYSTTKIHLLIDEETVTKGWKYNISFQYQQREMLAYLINRYGWTSHVFNSIQ